MTSASERQIILQRVTALRRLAKIGAAREEYPKLTEIDKWANEVEEYVKRK
jgi:hypothetical protein